LRLCVNLLGVRAFDPKRSRAKAQKCGGLFL
jgi:hypothetical protein